MAPEDDTMPIAEAMVLGEYASVKLVNDAQVHAIRLVYLPI
ncbi:hypothetical protein [Bradyrhizobium sp. CCBAU 51627]|nr:hypothetical protein [Bradyrhizobium sp. CCBAU 51627]